MRKKKKKKGEMKETERKKRKREKGCVTSRQRKPDVGPALSGVTLGAYWRVNRPGVHLGLPPGRVLEGEGALPGPGSTGLYAFTGRPGRQGNRAHDSKDLGQDSGLPRLQRRRS